MKIKDVIRISKNYYEKANRMNPAFLEKGQTEITWDDYNKAIKDAEDFNNQDIKITTQSNEKGNLGGEDGN